jgi:hypothetical protein
VGLVNRARRELDRAVEGLACRHLPPTVGLGRQAFYEQVELDEHRAYVLTRSVMTLSSMAEAAQPGMCAFLENRSRS